mmetsp:Transcript_620/g.1795  ORF Transcript_620/g.1795 Transcript_620/m.1795 type:complete len:164 (-) Transcript_620:48-539(-)
MARPLALLALLPAALGLVNVARAPRAPLRSARHAARLAPPAALDALLAAQLLAAPVDAARLDASTLTVAKTRVITREGLYGDYEVVIDDTPDPRDDARSTFKSRAATKKGKNKYLGIFVVLLFGSFVIPMAQYFWYVRDTPDSLFSDNEPPPPPPAKKNFWER